MLRNQFVLGLADDAVRNKVLAESKLAFSRSTEIESLVEQVNVGQDTTGYKELYMLQPTNQCKTWFEKHSNTKF